MSTGCEFYEDAIGDLVAGRLDPERQRRLERHLAGCPTCAATLDAARAVRAASAPVPAGLEDRIRTAVRTAVRKDGLEREGGRGGVAGDGPARGAVREGRREWARRWRPWAVPLAAAAALAIVWVGVDELERDVDAGVETTAEETELAPYGAWPAADGRIAGEPLLSELSEEQLEQLLEEMGS